MHQRDQGTRFIVISPRTRSFEAHEFDEAFVMNAQIGAELADVFLRKIDAAILAILAHVAQDVGQLECDAAFFGQLQGFGRLEAEDVNDGEANHASHLVAVAIQLVEGLELFGLQVRADAIDHFVEVLARDFVALDGIIKGRPQQMASEAAFERTVQILPPALDPLARCSLAFADIVAVTHEGVDGAHAFALLAGKKQEGVIEIAGARACDALAEGIRCLEPYRVFQRLPTSNWTRSNLEMAGRAASTL